jgi:hypothetical protein
MYNSPIKPRFRSMGAPRKLTPYDEDLLLSFFNRFPTSTLDEMTWFIWEERVILVSRPTISVVAEEEMDEEEVAPYRSQYVSGSTAELPGFNGWSSS